MKGKETGSEIFRESTLAKTYLKNATELTGLLHSS